MPDDDFQMAYRSARNRFGERAWHEIAPRERVAAIYEELRAIDAAREAENARLTTGRKADPR